MYKASLLTGVPKQTIRDRTRGLVDVECDSSGPSRLFTHEEEVAIVTQILETAQGCEGYTRKELQALITDFAVKWKNRPCTEKDLSDKWLCKFMKRHPELRAAQRKYLST